MPMQREWLEKDYYDVLGVAPDASEKDIKRAYRRLARQYHPDANPGDPQAEERFKAISAAYDVLGDPAERAQYDQVRRAAGSGVRTAASGFDGAGFGNVDFTSVDFAGAGFGTAGFDIGDLFGDLFARARGSGRSAAAAGRDLQTDLHLQFEEAVFGVAKPVELRMPVECERCTGSGCEPGTHPSTCRTCGGAGEVRTVRRTILGQMMTATPCSACRGTGREILSPCCDWPGGGRPLPGPVSPAISTCRSPCGPTPASSATATTCSTSCASR